MRAAVMTLDEAEAGPLRSRGRAKLRAVAGSDQGQRTWRDSLERRGDRIIGDERNVLAAMRIAPELTGLVRFNEFVGRVEFARIPPWRRVFLGDAWADQDDLGLQTYLQAQGIELRQRQSVAECVEAVARDWTVHPVREHLAALRWDETPRLQIWLAEYLNAEGPPDYLATIGAKFLVSAIARIQQPGCQVDHVLVLEGRQGCGKSESVKILGGGWTTDGLPDLHSKDSAIHLAGVWLVEIPELAAMRRSDLEVVKAFLSRRTDRFRPPYARRSVDVPRQCVFIATTNEAAYLRDPTGNRRFWPVRCGDRIDLEALARDRDQLWAEALQRFSQGEAWYPNETETLVASVEQEARMLVTTIEEQVAEYLDRQVSAGLDEVTTAQVFAGALGFEAAQDVERAGRLGRQLAEAMQRAGWQRVRASGRGRARRVIYRLTEAHRHTDS